MTQHMHIQLDIPPVEIPEHSIETYPYRHTYNPYPYEFPETFENDVENVEMTVLTINSLFSGMKKKSVIKLYTDVFVIKDTDHNWVLYYENNENYYEYDITELIEYLQSKEIQTLKRYDLHSTVLSFLNTLHF
jgi:hypothetical protein